MIQAGSSLIFQLLLYHGVCSPSWGEIKQITHSCVYCIFKNCPMPYIIYRRNLISAEWHWPEMVFCELTVGCTRKISLLRTSGLFLFNESLNRCPTGPYFHTLVSSRKLTNCWNKQVIIFKANTSPCDSRKQQILMGPKKGKTQPGLLIAGICKEASRRHTKIQVG